MAVVSLLGCGSPTTPAEVCAAYRDYLAACTTLTVDVAAECEELYERCEPEDRAAWTEYFECLTNNCEGDTAECSDLARYTVCPGT
jgi:hypothetical protein